MTTEISEATELRRLRWLARNGVADFGVAGERGVMDPARIADALISHGCRIGAVVSSPARWVVDLWPGAPAPQLNWDAALEAVYRHSLPRPCGETVARVELIARLMRDGGPWDAP